MWTWFRSPHPLPGRVSTVDVSTTIGGAATGTVLAGGVGAGGLSTGDAMVGGVVTGVVGGAVTGGAFGFGDGGLGLGRFPRCGRARLGSTGVCTGSVRVAASGWTTTASRTASFFATTS